MLFKKITPKDIEIIRPYLDRAKSRSCDYTIGGIFMWIDYFQYQYCILNDTLFIKGNAQDDMYHTAFSMPIGSMDIIDSIAHIRTYCNRKSIRMEFSGIPEEYLPEFERSNPSIFLEIPHWFDYIYDAETLASLSGNKMKKKRNHVNKFANTYPNAYLEEISITNIDLVKDCMREINTLAKGNDMAAYERQQVEIILNDHELYGLDSLCLINDGKVLAFTLGEVKNDTLFVHIEKAIHQYDGAAETINKSFAQKIVDKYNVKYINREDDGDDAGLRKAKQSYYPLFLLKKYNIIF